MKITKTLTIKNLMVLFAVSHMSINSWRKGTATKTPLEAIESEGKGVLFDPKFVKAWAKANKMALTGDPVALASDHSVAPKPGPKAKVKAAVEVAVAPTIKDVIKSVAARGAKVKAETPAKQATQIDSKPTVAPKAKSKGSATKAAKNAKDTATATPSRRVRSDAGTKVSATHA